MVKRAAIAFALFLAPLAGWAAFNEPMPGVVTMASLGTNVFLYLQSAADSATGFVSGNALGAGVQTALAAPFNGTGGLQGSLFPAPTAASAIQNAVNNASGLVQLNPSGYLPTTAQIGASNGGVAAVGNIGEVVSSDVVISSPVSVVTGTPKTITSVSLTAGDWTCRGAIATAPAASTTTSAIIGGLSTSTNTLPAGIEFRSQMTIALAANTPYAAPVPSVVENVSITTPIYLVGQSSFAASTMGMYGQISCRRER